MKIEIINGAVEIQGKTILEEINFSVTDGEHIAIVGKNGAGKSTLLKALIDTDLISQGIGESKLQINKIGKYTVGYLEQIKIDEDRTLFQELVESYQELREIEERLKYLEDKINTDELILEYTSLSDRYQVLGGYTYKKEIEVMISKFGFNSHDKEKVIKEFSGGEKMKITFMKLLLMRPDLLILDEPTNHLDIKTIEWLEEYLRNYKKAFIIVSHDRMFLDNTVKIIYDIEYGEVIKYHGNYSKFIKLKQERYDKLLKDYNYQQSEIKRLTGLYERFRYKPTKAKMALSKLKQIERMTMIDKPHKEDLRSFKVNFKEIVKPGRNVLQIRNLEFGYNKCLGRISLNVERGKKIGIIGANGIGKSTLLKTIAKIIKSLNGDIKYGFNVKEGYFDQNLEFITNGTIIDEFRYRFPDKTNEEARKILGSFMFSGSDVDKELTVLSGGEKVRLLLCCVFYQKANLLLLDEPTNHLDIVGKLKLEEVLKEYPETIIFVSHDRYFVREVADELIVIDENEIKHYKYGYQEYLEKRQVKERDKVKIEKVIDKKIEQVNDNDENKSRNNSLLRKIEKELDNLYKGLDKLKKELYKEEVYSDYVRLNEVNKEIEKLNEEIKIKEGEWEKYL